MSTLTRAGSDAAWASRVSADERRAGELLPRRLHPVHALLCGRARESGASALLLSGSTARRTRTPISDLDYHLVGEPITTEGLPEELDLHVVSAELLARRLREGDDFAQWSLRYGLVIFDSGVIRDAVRRIEQENLWPDVGRKREQAAKSLRIAEAMVASADHDAAVEQVRTALTLAARWRLLDHHRFPLSRSELPGQLTELGDTALATGLAATIHENPTLEQLAISVRQTQELLHAPTAVNASPPAEH